MTEKNGIGSLHSLLIPADTCRLPGDTAFLESEKHLLQKTEFIKMVLEGETTREFRGEREKANEVW